MAKRFTDNAIWGKPWFMAMSAQEKAFWFFIKDICDAVGVWEPNFQLAKTYLGFSIDWEKFREKCNGNIITLESGKWWLVDFCDFQYGDLDENSKCKPIISYIKLLKHHGIWELYKDILENGEEVAIEYAKGIHTLKEKEQDKEKEKVKEKEQDGQVKKTKDPKKTFGTSGLVSLTEKEYNDLLQKHGQILLDKFIEKLDAYKLASGTTYKSDAGAIRSWVVDQIVGKTPQKEVIKPFNLAAEYSSPSDDARFDKEWAEKVALMEKNRKIEEDREARKKEQASV